MNRNPSYPRAQASSSRSARASQPSSSQEQTANDLDPSHVRNIKRYGKWAELWSYEWREKIILLSTERTVKVYRSADKEHIEKMTWTSPVSETAEYSMPIGERDNFHGRMFTLMFMWDVGILIRCMIAQTQLTEMRIELERMLRGDTLERTLRGDYAVEKDVDEEIDEKTKGKTKSVIDDETIEAADHTTDDEVDEVDEEEDKKGKQKQRKKKNKKKKRKSRRR